MERLVLIAKKLRSEQNFNGYIHLKTIPGASDELMKQAAQYADRLSVNIEMPSEQSLKLLAPEKNHQDMMNPMEYLKNGIIQYKEEKKTFKKTPLFAPAGQSTQMVIGATADTDLQVLKTANHLYKKMHLKRVYYSGYVPISNDNRLPAIGTPVPIIRENRLYQADWLFRFYQFNMNEIVNTTFPQLDLDIDPKLGWALRNMNMFPVDINKADYHMILRIPGVGVLSAQKIISARKFTRLGWEHLQKIGIAKTRAKYFIVCKEIIDTMKDYTVQQIRNQILTLQNSKYEATFSSQMSLF